MNDGLYWTSDCPRLEFPDETRVFEVARLNGVPVATADGEAWMGRWVRC